MDHKLTWDNGVPTITDEMSGYTVSGVEECISYLMDCLNRCNEMRKGDSVDPAQLEINEDFMWCFAKLLKNVLACHE